MESPRVDKKAEVNKKKHYDLMATSLRNLNLFASQKCLYKQNYQLVAQNKFVNYHISFFSFYIEYFHKH